MLAAPVLVVAAVADDAGAGADADAVAVVLTSRARFFWPVVVLVCFLAEEVVPGFLSAPAAPPAAARLPFFRERDELAPRARPFDRRSVVGFASPSEPEIVQSESSMSSAVATSSLL